LNIITDRAVLLPKLYSLTLSRRKAIITILILEFIDVHHESTRQQPEREERRSPIDNATERGAVKVCPKENPVILPTKKKNQTTITRIRLIANENEFVSSRRSTLQVSFAKQVSFANHATSFQVSKPWQPGTQPKPW
jgi:hypothetical protein